MNSAELVMVKEFLNEFKSISDNLERIATATENLAVLIAPIEEELTEEN